MIVAPALGGSGLPASVNVSLVPEKYGDYGSSKLTFDVKSGPNSVPIKLEK